MPKESFLFSSPLLFSFYFSSLPKGLWTKHHNITSKKYMLQRLLFFMVPLIEKKKLKRTVDYLNLHITCRTKRFLWNNPPLINSLCHCKLRHNLQALITRQYNICVSFSLLLLLMYPPMVTLLSTQTWKNFFTNASILLLHFLIIIFLPPSQDLLFWDYLITMANLLSPGKL